MQNVRLRPSELVPEIFERYGVPVVNFDRVSVDSTLHNLTYSPNLDIRPDRPFCSIRVRDHVQNPQLLRGGSRYFPNNFDIPKHRARLSPCLLRDSAVELLLQTYPFRTSFRYV